jgi:hypothetical protein
MRGENRLGPLQWEAFRVGPLAWLDVDARPSLFPRLIHGAYRNESASPADAREAEKERKGKCYPMGTVTACSAVSVGGFGALRAQEQLVELV